jgi:hypothetical protein
MLPIKMSASPEKLSSHVVWVLGGWELLEGTAYGNLFVLYHVPGATEDTGPTLQFTHWLLLGCSAWMQRKIRNLRNRVVAPTEFYRKRGTREHSKGILLGGLPHLSLLSSFLLSPHIQHLFWEENQFTWVTGSPSGKGWLSEDVCRGQWRIRIPPYSHTWVVRGAYPVTSSPMPLLNPL